MIQFRLKAEDGSFNRLDSAFDSIANELDAAGRAVLTEFKPELMDALQDTPPKRSFPSDYPVEWTSNIQRKAYWTSDGFGKGIPSPRTGSHAKSWEISMQKLPNGISYTIRNRKKTSKFIYGSLAKRKRVARRFQQRFHSITGWPLATTEVQEWISVAQRLLEKEIKGRLDDSFTGKFIGRATTRR